MGHTTPDEQAMGQTGFVTNKAANNMATSADTIQNRIKIECGRSCSATSSS